MRHGPAVSALLLAALAGCATAAPGPGAPSGRIARSAEPTRQLRDEAEIDAAARLLRMEDTRVLDLPALESIAASPNPELRRRAALAAGRIRDSRGLPVLERLLADPDTAVAATGAFALGVLGDTAAVGLLVPLTTAERAAAMPTVAGEAAGALGKLRTERGRAAVAGLLRGAANDSASRLAVRHALLAAWKFPRRGGDAAPVLRWTESSDPELRWRAAFALTRRADPAATPELARLAADPDWRVRSFALRGLTAPLADSSSVGAAAARGLLLAALADTSTAVRVNAARSLGTHPHPSAVEALARLAGGGSAHLAVAGAESLGRLEAAAASAAPVLRATALDTTRVPGVRGAALAALAEIAGGEAAGAAARLAAERDWRSRAAAARAYARVGPVTRPEVYALARDPDPRVAAAALDAAAGAQGAPLDSLRPLLLESLAADDPIVRTNALGSLARLADPATLPAVLNAYGLARRDSLNDAALAALDAMVAIRAKGVPVARAFFARYPRSPDHNVRQRAEAVFADTARQAWGPVVPVATGLDSTLYRAVVREWVVPALEGWSPRVRIDTESGPIDLRLFAADAPLTTMNFAALAQQGFFDGQQWPRVVPNFVIQGGDPRGDTSGGPGYAIRDEINRHPYGTGTLGMALSGPDTGGSQWFVTHSPHPHLDGTYTVFGEVIEGMDVVNLVQVGETISRITRLR
ncbi:MAG: peptidylprolyl isomerase [Gemmatimonadota bacterium]